MSEKRINSSSVWKGLCLAARLVLGATFLVASADKILEPSRFALAVQNYNLLPKALIPVFSVTMPWLELVSGVLLIAGLAVEGAAVIVCALLSSFIVALTVNLLRGNQMDCGCFTILGEEPISWWTVGHDVALLILSLALLFGNQTTCGLENLIKNRRVRGAGATPGTPE